MDTINMIGAQLMDMGRDSASRDVIRGFLTRERKTLKMLVEVMERLNQFDGLPCDVLKAIDKPHLMSGNQWMSVSAKLPSDVNPLLKCAILRVGLAQLELEKHWRKFGDDVKAQ